MFGHIVISSLHNLKFISTCEMSAQNRKESKDVTRKNGGNLCTGSIAARARCVARQLRSSSLCTRSRSSPKPPITSITRSSPGSAPLQTNPVSQLRSQAEAPSEIPQPLRSNQQSLTQRPLRWRQSEAVAAFFCSFTLITYLLLVFSGFHTLSIMCPSIYYF